MDLNTLYISVRSGDSISEQELFKVLAARFQYFARRRIWNKDDCDDVVQNALAAVAANIRGVHIDVSFAAWAQKIMENEIALYYRKNKRRQDKFMTLADYDNPVFEQKTDHDIKRMLLDCLKKVSAVNRRYARILSLKYQGFDFDEICRRLTLTHTNAYSILSRARSMLDTCLEKGEVA